MSVESGLFIGEVTHFTRVAASFTHVVSRSITALHAVTVTWLTSSVHIGVFIYPLLIIVRTGSHAEWAILKMATGITLIRSLQNQQSYLHWDSTGRGRLTDRAGTGGRRLTYRAGTG